MKVKFNESRWMNLHGKLLSWDGLAELKFKASDEFRACVNGRSCRTVHEHVGDMRSTLVPILYDYGVDFCEHSLSFSHQ